MHPPLLARGRPGAVHAPTSSGSAACCSPAPTARRSASFAEETVGELVREHSKADLLTTLCSFFENMGSIRGSAAALDVHENTIRYRLSRIEELTGLAVMHDPDAQLRARLSLLVLLLQGRLPSGMRRRSPPASPSAIRAGGRRRSR